jgi:HD-like signal output (HDOD) protein
MPLHPDHPSTGASHLRTAVLTILRSPDFPAFSQQMQEIMAGLLDSGASVHQLANLVLREYSLSVKVLRTANSLHYNRSGRRISSATHAMILIGANTVRDLAASLLLFEHYHHQSPELKHLLLLSMLTAHHARETAAHRELDPPEAAHLTGMFYNLGEVLVACHFPQRYEQIQELCEQEDMPVLQAARKVLHFGYDDLAMEICQLWKMPAFVQNAIRAKGRSHDSVLDQITVLCHELTLAVYRTERTGCAAAITSVEERFTRQLGISRVQLREIIAVGMRETRALFASAGITLDDLRLARQQHAALRELGDDRFAESEEPLSEEASLALEREQMIDEVGSAMSHDAADLNAMVLVVLEAVLRGTPADRAAFCLLDSGRTVLQARSGLGADAAAIIPRIHMPTDVGTGRLLLAGKDVVIGTGRRAATAEERRWLHAFEAASCAFFPIRVEDKVIGALYCDRIDTAFPMDSPTIEFLRHLRTRIGQAIERMRNAAKPAETAADPPVRATPRKRASEG